MSRAALFTLDTCFEESFKCPSTRFQRSIASLSRLTTWKTIHYSANSITQTHKTHMMCIKNKGYEGTAPYVYNVYEEMINKFG